MPEQITETPVQNSIYSFLKDNGLTSKSEADFNTEYSDPNKVKELYGFFTENQLTSKDFDSFQKDNFSSVQAPEASQPQTFMQKELRDKGLIQDDSVGAKNTPTEQPKEEPGFISNLGSTVGNSFMTGMNQLNSWAADAPGFIYDLAGAPFRAVGLSVPTSQDFKDTPLQGISEFYKGNAKAYEQKVEQANPSRGNGVIASFENGDIEGGVLNLLGGIAESAPASIAMMLSGGATAPTIIGGAAIFGAGKAQEMDENAPEMNYDKRRVIAALNGTLEGVFETYLGSGAVGKSLAGIIKNEGKEVAQQSVKRSMSTLFSDMITKNPWLAPLGEGLEEVGTQISQNFVDKYSGYKPNLNLTDGVGDSFLSGVGMGGIHGAVIGLAKKAMEEKQSGTESTQQPIQSGPVSETPQFTVDPRQTKEAEIRQQAEGYASVDKGTIQVVELILPEGTDNSHAYVVGTVVGLDGKTVYRTRTDEGVEGFATEEQIAGEPQEIAVDDFVAGQMGIYDQTTQQQELLKKNQIQIDGIQYILTGDQTNEGYVAINPEDGSDIVIPASTVDNIRNSGQENANVVTQNYGKTQVSGIKNEDGSLSLSEPVSIDQANALKEQVEKSTGGNATVQTELIPNEDATAPQSFQLTIIPSAIPTHENINSEVTEQNNLQSVTSTPSQDNELSQNGQNQPAPTDELFSQPTERKVITQAIGKDNIDFVEGEDFDEVVPTDKMPLEKALPILEKKFKDHPKVVVVAEKVQVEVPGKVIKGETKWDDDITEPSTTKTVIKSIKIVPKEVIARQKQADTDILLDIIDEYNATPQSREDAQKASEINSIAKKLGYQTDRTPMNEIRLFDASGTISKPKVSEKSNSENVNIENVSINSDGQPDNQSVENVDSENNLQKSQLQNEESEKNIQQPDGIVANEGEDTPSQEQEEGVQENLEENVNQNIISTDQPVVESLTADPVADQIAQQGMNLNPSEAQIEAGNYKKAHVTIQGMDIAIENPKGSFRKGIDEDGKAWEAELKSHYGYFNGTVGKDNDHIDVFIGENPESQTVYVIDQVFDKGDKSGLFDESKVMLGYTSPNEAADAYMANYDESFNGLSDLTPVSVEDFKEWLYDGAKQRKPFADYKGTPAPLTDKTTKTELTEEQRITANNKLVDLVAEYNSIPKNHTNKKRIAFQNIQAGVQRLGYTVADNGGKLEIQSNGKKIQKIGTKQTIEDIQAHKALTDYPEGVQSFIQRFIDNSTELFGLDLHSTTKQAQQGVKNIQEGKKTVAANEVLDSFEKMFNDGVVRIKGSTTNSYHEIPIEEYFSTFDQSEDLSPEELSDNASELLWEIAEYYQLTLEQIEEIDNLFIEYGITSQIDTRTEGASDQISQAPEEIGSVEKEVPGKTETGELTPLEKEIASLQAEKTKLIAEKESNPYKANARNGLFGDIQANPNDLFGGQGFDAAQAKKLNDVIDQRISTIDQKVSELTQKVADVKATAEKENAGQQELVIPEAEDNEPETTSYSDPKRYDSTINVGERYYDNRYGDFYSIERMVPFGERDVEVTQKYDKGTTRTEKGSFLLYHIDEKQHTRDRVKPLSEFLADSKKEVQKKQSTPLPEEKPSPIYGANNKIVSNERAEELRKRLRDKLNNLNSGFDPELLAIGTELAAYHIESGARKFADFSKRMIEDVGEAIKPYLKSIYNGARDIPGMEEIEAEMTEYSEVKKADIDQILKQDIDNNVQSDKNEQDVSNRPDNSQPNSGKPADEVPGNEANVSGRGNGSRKARVKSTRSGSKAIGQSGSKVGSGLFTDLFGEQSDNELHKPDSEQPIEGNDAGDTDGRGSRIDGSEGLPNEQGADGSNNSDHPSTSGTFAERTAQKLIQQQAAENIQAVTGDIDNIRETLPFLLSEQQDDVLKAETRFFDLKHQTQELANGKGMLFTNGTGTGKTYTGLGIVKRFVKQGKVNVLIVVPSEAKVNDWANDGINLGLNITPLPNTTTGGTGQVVTTYANFRENQELLKREFDLVVYDESHRLMEEKKGATSSTTTSHYAISNKDLGSALGRLQDVHPVWIESKALYEKYRQANIGLNANMDLMDWQVADRVAEIKKMNDRLEDLDDQKKMLLPGLKEQAKQAVERTKVVFLSATPFKGHFNLRYANGILFDWGNEIVTNGRGSRVNPEARFFLDNFGGAYEWRYHKLNARRNANAEAIAMQEIQFAQKLMSQGVMSGRAIESDKDYSREFPLVALEQAEVFNKALNEIYSEEFEGLADAARDVFSDYNYTTKLFESLKASMNIERIKDHLALGRKVIVFHRRKQANVLPPFQSILDVTRVNANNVISGADQNTDEKTIEEAQKSLHHADMFESKYADLLRYEQTLNYSPAIDQVMSAFPGRVVTMNGDTPKKDKSGNVKLFNDDNSGKDIFVVQEEAGKEGISLHDTTGKHQRVLISLSLPISSTTALQIEGRPYRIGNESDAIFEYPLLGLDQEIIDFGSKVNKKLSTTENLAIGDQARDLLRSFAEGVLFNSGTDKPHANQGKGGKEYDKKAQETLSEFRKAVLVYNTNQKTSGRRDQREGVDYFATPEPVGQKMVEWLDLQAEETGLEPSAGHGAIAMWFPKHSNITAIEPSFSLFSKLNARSGGGDKKILNANFEDFNIINKFNGIAMNPPFGSGGKTAMDHVEKAFHHLKDGGRLVAIIPNGPSMTKRLDKFLYGEDENGRLLNPDAHLVGQIQLPSVAFEQAGTSVSSRIVIIDRIGLLSEQQIRNQVRTENNLRLLDSRFGLLPTQEEVNEEVQKRFNAQQSSLPSTLNIDLSDSKNVNDLFDEIENIEFPKPKRTEQTPDRSVPLMDVLANGKEAVSEVKESTGSKLLPVEEFTHTQTGQILYNVKINGRSDDYDKFSQVAKKHKPYTASKPWNRYSKGFLFNTKDDAIRFKNEVEGNSEVNEPNSDYLRTTDKNSDNEVNQPKRKYQTKEGETLQYSLFSDTDNGSGDTDLQRQDNRQQNPSLRKLKEGERSSIEMKYSLDKNFVFDGKNKIESTDDVAYLFKNLETKGVENMFACFVKDGKPTIIHMSMGNAHGTIMNYNVLADGISRFSPDKVYLIHNHPSGNLIQSNADLDIHNRAIDAFGEVIGEHIIINLTSGEYATFRRGASSHQINERPTEKSNSEKQYKVYNFDKQVFKQDTYLPAKITQSFEVASFISSQRFSEGNKLSALMLDRNNNIKAYLHLPDVDFNSQKSVNELIKELLAYTGRFGTSNVVLSGTRPTSVSSWNNLRALKAALKNADVTLLDYVSNVRSASSYDSTSDDGLLEPQAPYNKQLPLSDLLSQAKESVQAKKYNQEQIISKVEEPTSSNSEARPPLDSYLTNAAEQYKEKQKTKRNLAEVKEKVREFIQDHDLPIRRLEELVKKGGGAIKDNMKPYRDMSNSYGRNETLYKNFSKDKMEPVIKTISKIIKSGVSGIEVLPYMISKHAIERNAYMRENEFKEWEESAKAELQKWTDANINIPQATKDRKIKEFNDEVQAKRDELQKKDYSGVKGFDPEKRFDNPDELAQNIVDEFEDKVSIGLVDELWENVKEASSDIVSFWKAGQTMSAAQAEVTKNRFKYFIPLRGWREGAAKQLAYKKGDGFAGSLQRAKGRTSFAENPLAYLQQTAFKAIGEQVDNEVKTSLLNLVTGNYDTEFQKYYHLKKAYYVKVNLPDGTFEWEMTMDRPSEEMFASGDAKTKIYEQYQKLRTPSQAHEHEIYIKRPNGDMIVVMSDEMLPVAQSMNHKNTMYRNLFTGQINDAEFWNKPLSATIGVLNNSLKAMYTAWNVVFPLTNFARDIQEASITQFIKGDSGHMVLANYKNAFPAIIRDLRGKTPTGKYGMLLQEFRSVGGNTGFTHLKTPEELEKDIKAQLNITNRKGTFRGYTLDQLIKVKGAIEAWNQVFEDATRFSVYITSRDNGKSMGDAASDAKEASVNFNRKGKSSKAFDSIWAFWNVAIQSMQKNMKLAKDHPGRFGIVAGSWLALGFLEAMFNDWADDDDKYFRISEYVRENYLIIPNLSALISGEKSDKYLRIPLPQFWRGFKSAGSLAYDVMNGKMDVLSATGKGLSNFMGGMLPIDMGGFVQDGEFSIAPIVPTIYRTINEIDSNRDYMGFEIAKEPFTKEQEARLADSGLGKDNVNPAIKFATDWLFRAGGGDNENRFYTKDGVIKQVPGFLDINPSMVEHLITGYTGGTGRFIDDVLTTAMQATMPDKEVDFKNAPFLNSFFKKIPEAKWKIIGEYYDMKSDGNESKFDALKTSYFNQEDKTKFKELAPSGYYNEYNAVLDAYDQRLTLQMKFMDYKTAEGSEEVTNTMEEAIEAIKEVKQKYNRK